MQFLVKVICPLLFCLMLWSDIAVQQTIGIPQLQFLNEVIDVPVVPSRSYAPLCATTGALVVLLINKVVNTPVVPQRLIPMVLFCSDIHRD